MRPAGRLTGNHGRYLLACQALSHPSEEQEWPWFERVLRAYGLPEAIRADDGDLSDCYVRLLPVKNY